MSKENEISNEVIGAAIEVHRNLGPGLLESAHEECLCNEFDRRGIKYERQNLLPVTYKDTKLDCGYCLDLVVNDLVNIELKGG